MKDKYKTIYKGIMPAYYEDEDYCHIVINKLRETIARGDRAQIADAYGELTKYFNDLAKTVKEISIRFREASELLDDCLDDSRRPVCELNGEHGSTYRMALFRCYPMLDFDDGEYSLNSAIRRLAPHDRGYGANVISGRLRKERKNEG